MSQLNTLDEVQDVEALVEKMAHVQMDAEDGKLVSFLEQIATPFSHTSKDHVLVTELLNETQMELNQLRNEAG